MGCGSLRFEIEEEEEEEQEEEVGGDLTEGIVLRR